MLLKSLRPQPFLPTAGTTGETAKQYKPCGNVLFGTAIRHETGQVSQIQPYETNGGSTSNGAVLASHWLDD